MLPPVGDGDDFHVAGKPVDSTAVSKRIHYAVARLAQSLAECRRVLPLAKRLVVAAVHPQIVACKQPVYVAHPYFVCAVGTYITLEAPFAAQHLRKQSFMRASPLRTDTVETCHYSGALFLDDCLLEACKVDFAYALFVSPHVDAVAVDLLIV